MAMVLDPVLRAIVTICILVFSAKVLGEIFSWIKFPGYLGSCLQKILLGPFASGSFNIHKRFTYHSNIKRLSQEHCLFQRRLLLALQSGAIDFPEQQREVTSD